MKDFKTPDYFIISLLFGILLALTKSLFYATGLLILSITFIIIALIRIWMEN